MRRLVTAREQFEMLAPWLREAAPWRAKPGDPTYMIPTEELQRHRMHNPAIETPEDMHRDMYRQQRIEPVEGEPADKYHERGWKTNPTESGTREDEMVEAFEQGAKFPPVEITTNGPYARLSDGNHRVDIATMLGHPNLESYISYDPHEPDIGLSRYPPVDPNTELGRQIHKLVQNYDYQPVDRVKSNVFRRHPETGEWQRGKVIRERGVRPTGPHLNVDFGEGPESVPRHKLYAMVGAK